MRESRKTEKMQLPKDTTEAWLEAQKPSLRAVRHRKPPEDAMDAWVNRRVGDVLKGGKPKE